MIKTYRIYDPSPAERYRLWQAEQLLREAGFIRHADGTWDPGSRYDVREFGQTAGPGRARQQGQVPGA